MSKWVFPISLMVSLFFIMCFSNGIDLSRADPFMCIFWIWIIFTLVYGNVMLVGDGVDMMREFLAWRKSKSNTDP